MYNFYQSKLWRSINKDVYHKRTCEIGIFGTKYQGIIWEKQFLGKTFRWIQILWVEWLTHSQTTSLPSIVRKACRKRDPFCIQIGFTDIFANVSSFNVENRVIIDNLDDKRTYLNTGMKKIGLRRSFKENLPPSTYILNLTETVDMLWWRLSSQHKVKIKKAVKNCIICSAATDCEAREFYSVLKETSMAKWFSVVSDDKFDALLKWCNAQKNGTLYVAKKDGRVVAGALYLIDHVAQTGIYLYWATDKRVWNIGAWQALHWYIFCDLQEKWLQTIDLLWWAPIGDRNHPLSALSRFKEWFGWEKIEYVWSYDIVNSIFLYKLRAFTHK